MDKYNELKSLTRIYLSNIWKNHKSGGYLNKEQEQLVKIMEEHKEYHKIWEKSDNLRDTEYTVNGVNPFLHVFIHITIENQLNMGEPKIVTEIEKELKDLGFSHHDIIHVIGQALTTQIFNMSKNKVLFDEERYAKDLRKIMGKIRKK
ncbi:MAG: DUF1841 family protein [Candidatus Omnitrophica bacterium]|nr:DUF1841 family protein [Candidatus Omnitrophota bacterium]